MTVEGEAVTRVEAGAPAEPDCRGCPVGEVGYPSQYELLLYREWGVCKALGVLPSALDEMSAAEVDRMSEMAQVDAAFEEARWAQE